MNKVELVGRLTKDPEVKMTTNQTPYCNFTIAVDRRFKDANGQRQADFISCVAWRQTASFIQKYFRKGNKIGLVGSIQTRSYEDKNGQKRFITEVVVDEAEFVESTNNVVQQNQAETQAETQESPAVSVSETVQEEAPVDLPFEI